MRLNIVRAEKEVNERYLRIASLVGGYRNILIHEYPNTCDKFMVCVVKVKPRRYMYTSARNFVAAVHKVEIMVTYERSPLLLSDIDWRRRAGGGTRARDVFIGATRPRPARRRRPPVGLRRTSERRYL